MMSKINNVKKHRIAKIANLVAIGGLCLQPLVFAANHAAATEISTPVTKWSELKYMQDMTPEACASATGAYPSKQLIDDRDKKTYWVTKMGDGQCWMTQNLDLDLSTSTPLTPDNTNITGNWTPTENTQTSASPNFGTSNNIIKSWDPGYAYYANGTTKTTTGVDESWAKDTSGTNLNTHYLQGNYYSWVAAMAGNTTGNTSNNDICPKGWQLPLSNNGTTAKTFQALTNALGATSGTSTGSSDSKLLTSPGYFVRGGYVNNASLDGAGSSGFYWSSVPNGTNGAYFLGFNGNLVYPSVSNSRYGGMSVRCVASGTASATPAPSIPNPNINVVVPSILTIDVSNPADIQTESNKVNTGTFIATVTSNKNYALSLNAAGDSTSLINTKNGNQVGEISAVNQPTSNTSGWSIMACSGLEQTSCSTGAYKALPAKDASAVDSTFVSSHAAGSAQQTLFQIGIGVGPELPSGTYTTSITVTASQN